MKERTIVWLVLLLLSHAHSLDGSNATNLNSNDTTLQLVDWVVQQGGYWNPKQVFDRDDQGVFGVFAREPIEEGEVLAQIPWSAVIVSPSQRRSQRRFENCDTVQLLKDEFDKGDDGRFAIYTTALKRTARDHHSLLPAHWSPAGQALLQTVVNGTTTLLPPEDVFLREFKWKRRCELIDPHATLLVMTHGEDFGMVPVTDRYNSRGGDWVGAYFSIDGGDQGEMALEIRAYVDLEAGDQIYTDYRDYGDIGTPELLRDYGFVERYPQRYIFPLPKIAFDVDREEEEEEESGGELKAQRMGRNAAVPYTYPVRQQSQVSFLEREHERISKLCPELGTDALLKSTAAKDGGITQHELDTTKQFCRDMQLALEAVLKEVETSTQERELKERDCTDGPCNEL